MQLPEHRSVAFFSLKISREQIIDRLVHLVSKVEYRDYCNKFGIHSQKTVDAGISKLGESAIFIDDTPELSACEIQERIREGAGSFDLIIVDYLQVMGADSDDNQIHENLKRLKQIAKEEFCSVLILSELSQEPEKRAEHRPVLSDFDCPKIERHVDHIIYLYRDDYYNNTTDLKCIAELIIARNKHGDTSTVMLEWLPQYQRFCTIEKEGIFKTNYTE